MTPRASAVPACQAFRPGERWGFSASPAGSRSEVADLKTTSEASMGRGSPKVTSVMRAKGGESGDWNRAGVRDQGLGSRDAGWGDHVESGAAVVASLHSQGLPLCASSYFSVFSLADSNSSPFCQPINFGRLAASQPRANPNRAMAESPTKSMSGRYSSLGW